MSFPQTQFFFILNFTLKNAFLSSVGHSNPEQKYTYKVLDTFKELEKYDVTIRRSGCTALDLAYCAAGRLDGFWGHGLNLWDRLAGLYKAPKYHYKFDLPNLIDHEIPEYLWLFSGCHIPSAFVLENESHPGF